MSGDSLLRCPLCAAPLTRGATAYTCPGGHSFDLAREGYVHLLPPNRMHSKSPGDDREMAAARSRFLSGGYYDHLRDALCALALKYAPEHPAVLDSGCGEGYYTAALHRALALGGKAPRTVGIDLSKPSLRHGAKGAPEVAFAVASVYHLPVSDGSIDLVLNCFSPLALDEFRRVLKPGGTLLYVVPAAAHLWQLKEILYDAPYPNPEEAIDYDGFAYLEICPAERVLTLSGEALADLFRMTPYCWKTPKAGAERLAATRSLAVEADFRIHAFRRL